MGRSERLSAEILINLSGLHHTHPSDWQPVEEEAGLGAHSGWACLGTYYIGRNVVQM